MKLVYIILAHNEPEHVAELAETLIRGSSDAHVIIHFDGNSSRKDFTAVSQLVTSIGRAHLTKDRVKCRWGDYSLVDGVLRSLRQLVTDEIDFDYAILLSGACLPCRPIKQLERFLSENNGTQFIEAAGPEWMVGGLREERYLYWSPFPPSPNGRDWSRLLRKLQSRLGLKRKPPADLKIRFGSQWWALTGDCCRSILTMLSDNKNIERFFRSTYIPDEMMLQTLVYNEVGPESISGFNLTHYQFSDWGKALVYYDDHINYPFDLDKFFYRKVSAEAEGLRKKSLEHALFDDDGSDLSGIGSKNDDYKIKVASQIDKPRPGQIYYRDQYADHNGAVLKSLRRPYVFVVGQNPEHLQAFSPCVAGAELMELGRCFAPDQVDFGLENLEVEGLDRSDTRIRDMHPELYLCRIIERTPKVPIFHWCHGDSEQMLSSARWDDQALVVSLLSNAVSAGGLPGKVRGDGFSRRLIALGISPDELAQEEPWHLRGLMSRHDSMGAGRLEDSRVLHVPISSTGQYLFEFDPGGRLLESEFEKCPFFLQPWFVELAASLRGLVAQDDGILGQ